jgi:two-component system response regulator HydG
MMTRPVTVLLVDDERPIRASLRRLLTPEGFTVLEAADGREAMVLVARSVGAPIPPGPATPAETEPAELPPIDIILSDVRMPTATGLDLLRFVRQTAPQIEIILLTAYGEIADAVSALKLGAFNFLEKPFEPDALLLEIKRAQLLVMDRLGSARGRAAASSPRLIGRHPTMVALESIISRVAATDATVLISGESGTGKGLVARAIHDRSTRAREPFVAVHCGSIPESLIEAELFGHAKGAFAGAVADRDGRFAQAEGGTIFLDEIGEMPPAMQAKLLRVLQDRAYEPVGATTPKRGDFRVLDLSKAVAAGTFRQDLFYRLNVVPIEVPPLRDRLSDLPVLCEAFLAVQNEGHGTPLLPPDDACMDILRRYAWPGNVRELESLIERVAVLKGGGPVTEDDLPVAIRQSGTVEIRQLAGSLASTGTRSMNLNQELNRLEVELIKTALQQSGGNRNRASQILGLNRTTLIEKIKRLGLQSFADEQSEGGPSSRPPRASGE